MKKIIIATMSLVMAASMLAACAPKEENNENPETSVTTQSVTEAKPVDMNVVADAIIQNDKWPWKEMESTEDSEYIKEYFLLNTADYKNFYVSRSIMSSAFAEIIILEANDGKIEDAVKALEARKQKMLDQDVFYPSHQEVAADALIDSTGNFAILIVGAEDNEAVMEAAKAVING